MNRPLSRFMDSNHVFFSFVLLFRLCISFDTMDITGCHFEYDTIDAYVSCLLVCIAFFFLGHVI